MDNEVMNNVTTETATTDEVIEIVDTPAVQPEEKKGLTGGQKAVGFTVLGFAVLGIWKLGELVIKGAKWLFGKIKGNKADKADESKDEKTENVEKVEGTVTEIDNETMDEIQKK